MKISHDNITHKGISSFIESRLLLNKALVDASTDIPIVIMANNSTERKERLRRALMGWSLGFATPFVTLPLTNRLSLLGLTNGFTSKENQIIQVSNKDLNNINNTKKAVEALAKKYKFSSDEIIKKAGGIEKLRKHLINSKCGVLAFDFLFTAGLLGGIGYLNNFLTRKKTGQKGFSAEFNMADSKIVEKRAENYDKRETLMKASFLAILASLTASPLLLRKALIKNSPKGFSGVLNKYANKFDYDDGILMKRIPMMLMTAVGVYGVTSASRNKTEVKDNLIRTVIGNIVFFGGDLVIASILASISDKIFKTEILDKNCDKNWINKILPPVKHLKDMNGKSRKVGTALFWINMAALSASIGFGVPAALNKMIKKDVEKSKTLEYN